MNIEEWLNIGVENQWIIPFCAAHDPIPMTDSELSDAKSVNGDLCIPVLKILLGEE